MKKQTIKLITWNIRWGRGIDNIVNLDRIIDHLNRFSDFDILCLQEVASGYQDPELKFADGNDQFELLSQKLSAYHSVSGFAVEQTHIGQKSKRFGNMTFSRFPIVQTYRHRLPQPAIPHTKSMPRMAIETLIKTPIGILCVINTHLEFYSSLQRMAQVKYLKTICQNAWKHSTLSNSSKESGPFSAFPKITGTILTGDFNFLADAKERRELLSPCENSNKHSIIDAWESFYPNQFHLPTMGYFDSKRWPNGPFVSDYIFISENLAPRILDFQVEKESTASDHQALLLTLNCKDL